MVTTSDVHVDSALHIPKRNKRLRRTPAKGYNAPMTTSKVSTPMALPNKGRMTPTDQTRGFSAPEGNVAYADEKKNKEFASITVATKGIQKLRRIRANRNSRMVSEATIKKAAPRKPSSKSSEEEFAVGALAKAGLGLLKKKKQIVPGTSVKSGLSRLQPRRTSATLSPTARKGRALSDTRKKAATAVKRSANSQSRRAQAAKNPLLSTKAGQQARRLKRGIKRNPQRSAAIAAGAGLGAGYLLSNDEDFDENEFSALYKKGLKTGAGVAGGLGGLIGIGHGVRQKRKGRKKGRAEGFIYRGTPGGQALHKKLKKVHASDIVFGEEDFAGLDKIVKNVRENSKNSDREFADETKKGITLQ